MTTQLEQSPPVTLEQQLTDEQRKTLNDAEQIFREVFDRKGESFILSFHAGWENLSITYFTPNKVQHGSLWQAESDNTFADKMDYALELRATEDGRADQIKAERVEALRKELADLTAEPSAIADEYLSAEVGQ